MGKLIQNAGCYDWTNSGDSTVTSGTPVVNGSLFGCAIRDIAPGALGAIQVDGIWELPIASATTASIGAAAYWDATNSQVTATASTNLPIGKFVKASANGETTCQIMLGYAAIAAAGSGTGS